MIDPSHSATTGLGDLLRHLAQRRAPADRSPLLAMGEIVRPAAERATLPLAPELIIAWRALIGDESWLWQRQALETVRRGESLVLVAPPPLGVATLLLLAADRPGFRAHAAASSTTLLLAPTASAFMSLARAAASLDALLGGGLPHLALDMGTPVPRRPVPLLLTTPDVLHGRILRHHDRAWRWLWQSLRRVIIPAADESVGAPLGHLRWLLRRVARLLYEQRPVQLLVGIQPTPEPLATASLLVGRPLAAAVAGETAGVTTWAIWRSGADSAAEAVSLAGELRAAGLSVALLGRDDLERALLDRAGLATGLVGASWARKPEQAVILPWSAEASLIPALAGAGYRLVVALADPSLPGHLFRFNPPLAAPEAPLPWPQASLNPYVAAAHLRCAAEEYPLDIAEVAEWECESLVERLERRGLLAWLPGDQDRWQPVAGDSDPYEELSIGGVGGPPATIVDEQDSLLGEVESTLLERRFYPGATLPGAHVAAWIESEIVQVAAGAAVWTAPLRRTQVTIREEIAQRQIAGSRLPLQLHWGKVVVQEEISGRVEWNGERAATTVAFDPPLTVQWSAPACWIDVPEGAQATPEAALLWAAVIPLVLRCRPEDIVPCGAGGAVYLVEAQPGGRGLAEAIYERAEQTLALAQAAALAGTGTAPWGEAAALALCWLDPLLGRRDMLQQGDQGATYPAEAHEQRRPSPSRPEPSRQGRHKRAGATTRIPGSTIYPIQPSEIERPPFLSRSRQPAQPSEEQPAEGRASEMQHREQYPREKLSSEQPQAEVQPPETQRKQPGDERMSARYRGARSGQPAPDIRPGSPVREEPEQQLPAAAPRHSDKAPPKRPLERRREEQPPTDRRGPEQQPRQREGARRGPERRHVERTPSPASGGRQPPSSPPQEQPPDAAALIERARRMREQREAQARLQEQGRRPPAGRKQAATEEPVESRFAVGQRISCLPYGEGVVRRVRRSGSRELLDVEFPDYGELQIDPIISLVRPVSAAPPADGEEG
ncbi:MAG: helicase [Herpetosiphonaceae bacterium]|nr:MAG: helicase [Herpetosiphonaceae bacterium]